jgi:hypothetical protein
LRAAATLFVVSVVLITGCANMPGNSASEAKERCHRRGVVKTCVPISPLSSAQIAEVRQLRGTSKVNSRIVIIRNDWFDVHGHAAVNLDGSPLVDTIPFSTMAVDIDPGEHVLQAGPKTSAGLPLRLFSKPGEVAVVRLRRSFSRQDFLGFALEQIDSHEGLRLVQECSVIAFLDRRVGSSK